MKNLAIALVIVLVVCGITSGVIALFFKSADEVIAKESKPIEDPVPGAPPGVISYKADGNWAIAVCMGKGIGHRTSQMESWAVLWTLNTMEEQGFEIYQITWRGSGAGVRVYGRKVKTDG